MECFYGDDILMKSGNVNIDLIYWSILIESTDVTEPSTVTPVAMRAVLGHRLLPPRWLSALSHGDFPCLLQSEHLPTFRRVKDELHKNLMSIQYSNEKLKQE